ncbi:hypothetical protein PRUPE_4G251800 [Prunus persica]|uniref:Uncharacterized protein n=1 Tax=Prunus persica TaxID=3760 RepID=A0A251PS36_PRUPE|nr:hypothetical protein PRUPE_4G251800 [Prunus persica]
MRNLGFGCATCYHLVGFLGSKYRLVGGLSDFYSPNLALCLSSYSASCTKMALHAPVNNQQCQIHRLNLHHRTQIQLRNLSFNIPISKFGFSLRSRSISHPLLC